MLDQFLRGNVKKRTDEYEGSVEKRSRFILEVLSAVCDAHLLGVHLGASMHLRGPVTDKLDRDHAVIHMTQMAFAWPKSILQGKRISLLELHRDLIMSGMKGTSVSSTKSMMCSDEIDRKQLNTHPHPCVLEIGPRVTSLRFVLRIHLVSYWLINRVGTNPRKTTTPA